MQLGAFNFLLAAQQKMSLTSKWIAYTRRHKRGKASTVYVRMKLTRKINHRAVIIAAHENRYIFIGQFIVPALHAMGFSREPYTRNYPRFGCVVCVRSIRAAMPLLMPVDVWK